VDMFSAPSAKTPRGMKARSCSKICLVLEDTAKLFSNVAVPFCISTTKSETNSGFSHPHQDLMAF
jgi:hypothetical protein